MPDNISVTFLGTASAQPSPTRNHSALAVRIDRDVWLFDCGEGTQLQIQKSVVRPGRISKIFITHTHGDHIFGLVPLIASIMNGAGGTTGDTDDPRISNQSDTSIPALEIYGPLGTRAYMRSNLKYTHTLLDRPYIVHELRFSDDPQDGDGTDLPLHACERAGKNILQENGVWPKIYDDDLITVSSGPILHSVPCVGYVIDEKDRPGKIDPKQYVPHLKRTNTPLSVLRTLQQGQSVQLSDGTVLQGPPRTKGRKIVILGDTHDPSPIEPIAMGPSLLIHEATNAHLPKNLDRTIKPTDTFESVQERTMSRGHSTPQMAGKFATRIRAEKLVMNHFSVRYAGDDDVNDETKLVMEAIRDLARKEFTGPVICARDLMTVDVPA